jgi:hypothetical protein
MSRRMPGPNFRDRNGAHPSLVLPPGVQPVQTIPVFDFDGFTFPAAVKPDQLCLIEMAYRARRGDSAAVAVLDQWGIFIHDVRGRSYWPVQSEAPAAGDAPPPPPEATGP